MALNEAECQKCRVELDKLKAQYEQAGDIPEVAKAHINELDAALERECKSDSRSSDHSSGVGAAVAVGFGLAGLAALLKALFGRR